MTYCVTCLQFEITDENGQCSKCRNKKKITDVWGEEIPHLARLYKEE